MFKCLSMGKNNVCNDHHTGPSTMAALCRWDPLPKEGELALARRYQVDGDAEASNMLAKANLRFAAKISLEYAQAYGLRFDDIMGAAMTGLALGIRKFKPEKDVRLISYAIFWIRAEIHHYIIRNWRSVTIKGGRKVLRVFEKVISRRFIEMLDRLKSGGTLTDEEMADLTLDGYLSVDELMKGKQMVQQDVSIDDTQGTDDDDDMHHGAYWGDQDHNGAMADHGPSPEDESRGAQTAEKLRQALAEIRPTLTERERYILKHRTLPDITGEDPQTLQEIGDRFSISRERIRQIESKTRKKLRSSLMARGIQPSYES